MWVALVIIPAFAGRKRCRIIVPFRTIVELMLEVIFATSLNRTLIVRVKAHTHPRLTPDASTNLSISA